MELGQSIHSLRLFVFDSFDPLCALDRLSRLLHLVETMGESRPHAGVVWLGLRCVEVVVGSIAVELVQLVCLAQAIPRPVVVFVDVDGGAVAFDRSVRIFHLEVLVAHQSPR